MGALLKDLFPSTGAGGTFPFILISRRPGSGQGSPWIPRFVFRTSGASPGQRLWRPEFSLSRTYAEFQHPRKEVMSHIGKQDCTMPRSAWASVRCCHCNPPVPALSPSLPPSPGTMLNAKSRIKLAGLDPLGPCVHEVYGEMPRSPRSPLDSGPWVGPGRVGHRRQIALAPRQGAPQHDPHKGSGCAGPRPQGGRGHRPESPRGHRGQGKHAVDRATVFGAEVFRHGRAAQNGHDPVAPVEGRDGRAGAGGAVCSSSSPHISGS